MNDGVGPLQDSKCHWAWYKWRKDSPEITDLGLQPMEDTGPQIPKAAQYLITKLHWIDEFHTNNLYIQSGKEIGLLNSPTFFVSRVNKGRLVPKALGRIIYLNKGGEAVLKEKPLRPDEDSTQEIPRFFIQVVLWYKMTNSYYYIKNFKDNGSSNKRERDGWYTPRVLARINFTVTETKCTPIFPNPKSKNFYLQEGERFSCQRRKNTPAWEPTITAVQVASIWGLHKEYALVNLKLVNLLSLLPLYNNF